MFDLKDNTVKTNIFFLKKTNVGYLVSEFAIFTQKEGYFVSDM